MTIQANAGAPTIKPSWPVAIGTSLSVSTLAIGANTEKVAFIGRLWWPGAGDTGQHINSFNVITNTEGNPRMTLQFSQQGVHATADAQPDGTPVSTGSSVISADPGAATEIIGPALSSPPAVVRGQLVALVVEATAYTSGALNLSILNQDYADQGAWARRYTASAWAAVATGIPIVKVILDSGVIGTLIGAAYLIPGSEAFASNSSPAVRGNKFLYATPQQILGFKCTVNPGADTRPFKVQLFKGNVLQEEVSVLGYNVALPTGLKLFTGAFSTRYTMAANEAWYLGFAPQTTSNGTLEIMTVPSAGDMVLAPDGADVLYSTFNGSVWAAATATKRATMSLLVSGVDNGIGGGPVARIGLD